MSTANWKNFCLHFGVGDILNESNPCGARLGLGMKNVKQYTHTHSDTQKSAFLARRTAIIEQCCALWIRLFVSPSCLKSSPASLAFFLPCKIVSSEGDFALVGTFGMGGTAGPLFHGKNRVRHVPPGCSFDRRAAVVLFAARHTQTRWE